ncbi:cupin domain-containing protein [Photorhabdus temperata]|uniref:Cupin domain-containing protein n=1 Tax=Photorhabdus temperata subsp. temperata Meg1 TaxID=1393735 RepID=A0A081S102_PHOTE|nr:cupin domain-containing protein [Photorhabdus temperata]KER04605.1 cupin domain-containing protein [Photorhabdus temperata subsp. temperata Meg1]
MKNHLFVFNQGAISTLLNNYKKSLDDIPFLNFTLKGEIFFNDFNSVKAFASSVSLPVQDILSLLDNYPYDLEAGVKISRGGTQFERIKTSEAGDLYHYRHVMKTLADPELMVLKTTPLCNDLYKMKLNTGHKVKEVVYVLQGEVGVLWLSKQRERRRDSLKQGDSIYIDSWVPHAFYSIVKDSHILAIDYF